MKRPYLLILLGLVQVAANAGESKTAVFAGGCFWCMEAAFQELEGVRDVVSGFTGGTLKNPTYAGRHDGHYEAVRITYDPDVVSYQNLLDHFWMNIDPFDRRGQFCDKGFSYLSAIFVDGKDELETAYASKQAVIERFPDRKVVLPILERKTFYPVKEYHQDYYIKNPIRYGFYRMACGRGQRLEAIWGEDAGRISNSNSRDETGFFTRLSKAFGRLFGSG